MTTRSELLALHDQQVRGTIAEDHPKDLGMRKLWIAVGVNLLLGIPAVVPIFLGWYFLSTGPLASLGWTEPYPDENEGILPMMIFIVPILCLSVVIWVLVNWGLRRKLAVPPARYWPACLAASFVPFFALFGLL